MGDRQMLHATGDEAVEGAALLGVHVPRDAEPPPCEKMLRRATGVAVLLLLFRIGVQTIAGGTGDGIGLGWALGT